MDHSDTVIGTLAVDGWAVTFSTARRGLSGVAARPVLSSLTCRRLSATGFKSSLNRLYKRNAMTWAGHTQSVVSSPETDRSAGCTWLHRQ